MQKPLLFISSPIVMREYVQTENMQLQEDSIEQQELQEQSMRQGEKNDILMRQLLYFLRLPKRHRYIKLKLTDGAEVKGTLLQLEGNVVSVDENGEVMQVKHKNIVGLQRLSGRI